MNVNRTTSLKGLRTHQALSREQVAAAVGVSYGQVAAWEWGKQWPRLDNARRLADALAVSLDDLFDAMAADRQAAETAAPPAD